MVGAVASPGVDLLITIASTVNAGIFWWLASTGERSIRASRLMDSGGLLLNSFIGALTGRYLLATFANDHALASVQAVNMADGHVSMLQLGGMGLMMAIRAALVPSSPRRTILITAAFAVPMIVVTALVMPVPGGGLAWRGLDSGALPWLPAALLIMWGFTIITCAVISQVIYGLRAEVLEARRLGQYVIEKKIGAGGMGEVSWTRVALSRQAEWCGSCRWRAARLPAPECILSPDAVDARADLYALGAVAYYLLAGTDVFDGKSVVEVCSQHLYQQPPTFAEKGVSISPELEAVVQSCLEKDPNLRPQTAVDLRRRIEACQVEPWDRAAAFDWWSAHPADLDVDAVLSSGEAKTIAVDGIHRELALLDRAFVQCCVLRNDAIGAEALHRQAHPLSRHSRVECGV